jgi:thiamine-monophosphate kinase
MNSTKFPSEEYRLLETLKKFFNYTPDERFPVGIGDDAAIRRCLAGEQLVLTADCLVENVHFSFSYMTPEEIGYKAMVANISDCAAMGAQPDSALVQLIFPRSADPLEREGRICRLYAGMHAACVRWGYPVVGGDLSAGDCWTLAISMTGRSSAHERLLRRVGVRQGDTLWVTGFAGMSGAGLAVLRKWGRNAYKDAFQDLVAAHIAPEAQVDLGRLLSADPAVHAAIDVSDGIAKECHTLCHDNEAGMELVLPAECMALSMNNLAAELGCSPYEWFLYGGEDYLLLFTASPQFDASRYRNDRTRLFPIGKVTGNRRSVTLIDAAGQEIPVEKRAWDHLRSLPV